MMQAIEAEKSVIGGCLLEPDALDLAISGLSPEDFDHPGHRRIFAAMQRLSDEHQPVDLVSLTYALREAGNLEEAGGSAYLAELVDFVPTAANVGFYIAAIRKTATHRRLLGIAEGVRFRLEDEPDPAKVLEEFESRLFALRESATTGGPVPVRDGAEAILDRWETAGLTPGEPPGLRTGFSRFDAMSGGLEPGNLYLLAARPGAGKTAFALAVAESVSIRQRMPSLFFSLEMGQEQLAGRLLTAMAGVDGAQARVGRLETGDYGRLEEAAKRLKAAPVFVDDEAALSIAEIRARARRLRRREGVRLVIVDYLQLVAGGLAKGATREAEVATVSRGLKALARELCVPVIALAQLNRSLENRTDKRPMLSDLRESGSLEQDADLVAFLHRPGVTDPNTDPGAVEMLIAKNRHGPLGRVPLRFRPEYCRFEQPARPETRPAEPGNLFTGG